MKFCSTLAAFAAATCLALAGTSAVADTYPSRPITWIVPFTPGGITDSGARIIAKALSERIRQPVLVENRPGAGGVVGTEFVAKSKPDGYTMVYGTAGTIATNPVLYKNLSFDTRKDLVAVHGMAVSPPVLVANPEKPYKTVAEFIAYAKKNPEKVNFASAGAGTTTHLAGELFQQVTGTKLTHVPYKGSAPALTDVIAGVADVIFDYPVTIIPLAAADKLRPLATLTPQRLDVLPNVPTIAESGYPDGEISSWSGIFVAKDTPPDVVAKLGAEFGKALEDPAVAKYFADNGQVRLVGWTKDKFDPFIDKEMVKWKKLIEASGAKAF
ncbi:tripartite tricarboxylate transporter substrate binding protein [Bradyrhizobium sp. LHD-71]|uniref:Bug family tripartite tricarboxylate transporter substrate binding protein n=1 Tax=Bradyrhizobium sp. LHD-71 TaxID=3072141 RepID=UPI00280ED817|nr:tripartite tricarboxylate transporter substrate binding protein [Bradyrhizobium sp. LHD-71]MDQ8726223.1 tripartite tricarboxylate transporter substrate binding protein [Bradyrhizobium sp. LHD-71]